MSKLELSIKYAYRHYSTALSSGNGARKRRKGQLARKYNNTIIIIFRHQAIYEEFIFFFVNNSQVTKAHDSLNNHISNKGLNSHFSQYFNILSFLISISEQRKPFTKSW